MFNKKLKENVITERVEITKLVKQRTNEIKYIVVKKYQTKKVGIDYSFHRPISKL